MNLALMILAAALFMILERVWHVSKPREVKYCWIQACACSLLLIATSGCGAYGARERHGAGQAYAGVRIDIYYLAHPEKADLPFLQPLNVIDLPVSFAADTLMLPYDLWKGN